MASTNVKRKKRRRKSNKTNNQIIVCIQFILILLIIGGLIMLYAHINSTKDNTPTTGDYSANASSEHTEKQTAIQAGATTATESSTKQPPSSSATGPTESSTQTTTAVANPTTQAATEATTTAQETTTMAPEDTPWYLILVNPYHYMPEDYKIELANIGNARVDARIAEPLKQMLADCKAAGLSPVINSSFRTHNDQIFLYNRKTNYYLNLGYDEAEAKRLAGTVIAVPGTSEHELGLAVDLTAYSYQVLDEKQENTAEQKWLMANCHKYGFILRYPNNKSDITHIIYEPWHYRYVGVEVATEIMTKGITLEEYLGIID